MELQALLRAAAVGGVREATARIFGHVLGTGLRSGHKILRRPLKGHKLLQWYPDPVEYGMKGFTPGEEERLEKLDRLKRAGKGPPKKGQGKRATKRGK